MTRFHFHNSPPMPVLKVRETPHLEGTTHAHQTGTVLWVSPRLNTALREAHQQGSEMVNAILATVTVTCWPAIRPQSRLVIPGPLEMPGVSPR